MAHYHAVVWIDHQEARIFQFGRDGSDTHVVRSHQAGVWAHHRDTSAGSRHGAADEAFYAEVGAALAGSQAILIMGPAQAKTEFVKHLKLHAPSVASHVAAVESSDHASDQAIVAHGRSYFRLDHQEAARTSSGRPAGG